MNFQKRIQLIFLLLVIGISGCSLAPKDVEIVAADRDIRYWELSPDGNALVYGGTGSEENYLIDLPSGEKQKIDCSLSWLNDEMLLCRRYNYEVGLQITTLDRNVFIESAPFNEADINTLSDAELNELLANAENIFRMAGSNAGYVYILNANSTNYVITGVKDLDSILFNHPYKTFPARQFYCPQDALDEKGLSPDGMYYYTAMRQRKSVLSIFSVSDNEKVVSFTTGEAEFIECGGWAGDSSGVFFRVHGVAFHAPEVPAEIMKLKVPSK